MGLISGGLITGILRYTCPVFSMDGSFIIRLSNPSLKLINRLYLGLKI